jgi:hypothetical protein
MLFTLFTESRYPGTNPVPQELVSTQIPTDVILKPSLFFINMRRGYDERYNNDYNETDFNDIIKILGFDKNNIKNNYVTIVANNNNNKLYATNTDLIMNEFRELYKKR